MGHELDCPQQFGIWEVDGLGLVVAFRCSSGATAAACWLKVWGSCVAPLRHRAGCAAVQGHGFGGGCAHRCQHHAGAAGPDAGCVLQTMQLIYITREACPGMQGALCMPVLPMVHPATCADVRPPRVRAGRGAVQVHRGFYEGAKRHLEEIAQAVAAADSAAGGRLPVWVTGHSLGGGYANALALHLLAGRATAELFGAGAQLPPYFVHGWGRRDFPVERCSTHPVAHHAMALWGTPGGLQAPGRSHWPSALIGWSHRTHRDMGRPRTSLSEARAPAGCIAQAAARSPSALQWWCTARRRSSCMRSWRPWSASQSAPRAATGRTSCSSTTWCPLVWPPSRQHGTRWRVSICLELQGIFKP